MVPEKVCNFGACKRTLSFHFRFARYFAAPKGCASIRIRCSRFPSTSNKLQFLNLKSISVDFLVAQATHRRQISETIAPLPKYRCGNRSRTPEYIAQKITNGNAVIALKEKNLLVFAISSLGSRKICGSF